MKITYEPLLVGNRSGMSHSFVLERVALGMGSFINEPVFFEPDPQVCDVFVKTMKEVFETSKSRRDNPQPEIMCYVRDQAEADQLKRVLVDYVTRCDGRELAAKMNKWFGLPRILPASLFFRAK